MTIGIVWPPLQFLAYRLPAFTTSSRRWDRHFPRHLYVALHAARFSPYFTIAPYNCSAIAQQLLSQCSAAFKGHCNLLNELFNRFQIKRLYCTNDLALLKFDQCRKFFYFKFFDHLCVSVSINKCYLDTAFLGIFLCCDL